MLLQIGERFTVAMFVAANKSIVPLRLSSWVIVPARPRFIGNNGWVRSSA